MRPGKRSRWKLPNPFDKRAPLPAIAFPSQSSFSVGEAVIEGSSCAPDEPPEAAQRFAILPLAPVDRPFDYCAPEAMGLGAGDYVRISFGGREVLGCVWGKGSDADLPELKSVTQRLAVPPMRAAMRAFLEKQSAYTLAPLGQCLKLACRRSELLAPPSLARHLRATGRLPARMSAARRKVLDALGTEKTPPDRARLAAIAGVSSSVVAGLVRESVLEEVQTPLIPSCAPLNPAFARVALSQAQAQAARALREAVSADAFGVWALCGVTGSGKTAVYLEAVETALAQGRQVLVLLPEIALTEAFIARIEARFGGSPAQWHSALTGAQRRRFWRAVAHGRAQMVVGARSALFLPFSALGLIVVDEEHDPGYRQEDGVRYHARDMAVLRAREENCPIVLSSATPSLETWENARSGRYRRLDLPERFGGARAPRVRLVDLLDDPPPKGRWLAPQVCEATAETLARGEQSLFFLNRRGYAPLTLCRTCGFRLGCPRCACWLVEHRTARALRCHQCGHAQPMVTHCPKCRKGNLAACGPGVERLAEEIGALFPDARTETLSSDTVRDQAFLGAALGRIERGETDIIVGTQILAKGHHFPHLTLVVAVDADLGLRGGDLRGAELTFQITQQVIGRAGREARQGHALIQTIAPDDPVMQALCANDMDGFMRAEAGMRERDAVPPFGRYGAIILSAFDEARVARAAHGVAQSLSLALDGKACCVFGPAPAPLARLRGQYRFRLLVKAPRAAPLSQMLGAWLKGARIPAQVRCLVDIDPRNFL